MQLHGANGILSTGVGPHLTVQFHLSPSIHLDGQYSSFEVPTIFDQTLLVGDPSSTL